jgi:hypothetical protein
MISIEDNNKILENVKQIFKNLEAIEVFFPKDALKLIITHAIIYDSLGDFCVEMAKHMEQDVNESRR